MSTCRYAPIGLHEINSRTAALTMHVCIRNDDHAWRDGMSLLKENITGMCVLPRVYVCTASGSKSLFCTFVLPVARSGMLHVACVARRFVYQKAACALPQASVHDEHVHGLLGVHEYARAFGPKWPKHAYILSRYDQMRCCVHMYAGYLARQYVLHSSR